MKNYLFLAVLLLPACAVYKYTPTLDDKLSGPARTIVSNSVLELEKTTNANADLTVDYESNYLVTQLFEQVKVEFSQSGNTRIKVTKFEKLYPWGGKGFQCFEPYLLILSLGIIPSVCEQEYRVTVAIQNTRENNSIEKEFIYKVDSVTGWMSLFYAPSSDWTYKHVDVEKHAFYTLINGFAADYKVKENLPSD